MDSVDVDLERKTTDDPEELLSRLESLPAYDSLTQLSDEPPAIFDDEQEPSSGLIELLRKNSQVEEPTPVEDIEEDSTNAILNDDVETSSSTKSENDHEEPDGEAHQRLLKSRLKHLFILSENGKPVYTRYGDEDQLVTLMGVMQTLVSFSELPENSPIKFIKAGQCRIAFLHREPLVLVMTTHTNEHGASLIQQLTYAYHQIISTLTLSRIKHRFSVQPNFDLRSWLPSSEKKLLHNILDMYEQDLGMLMTAAKCLVLPSGIRNQISQTVVQTVRGQRDMVFALILCHSHLVTFARLRNFHLHPSDLFILINLINSTDAFKGVQSWVPICLPRFDNGGCLHSYISYLDDACDVCLVLLTVNPEHFQILANFKQIIGDKLKKSNLINQISLALDRDRTLLDDIACNDLRYFAYKSRGLSQYISTKLVQPYKSDDQRIRLFELIRFIYGRLHHSNHHLKIVYATTEHEALLGWLAPGFELHIVFSPLVTMEAVISCIDRILSYIKHEESQLFIMKCECF